MDMSDNEDSKLCAVIPHHAPAAVQRPAAGAQLGKGGKPPVASPVSPPEAAGAQAPVTAFPARITELPPVRKRRVETRKNARLAAASLADPKRDAGRFVFSIRLSPPERAAIEEKARAAGLSIASFIRATALGSPGPRARRSPPVNVELLSYAVGQLNKSGNNLNQIAHRLNAAQATSSAEVDAAAAETRAALALIREAFGRTDRI